MFFSRSIEDRPDRVSKRTTAFREDGGAELITIINLEFDGCEFTSSSSFRPGELLRLHLPGQGWIKVEVQRIFGELIGANFVTECSV